MSENNVCKLCQKIGHYPIDCPDKCLCGILHAAQTHICELCHANGHWILNCPDQCPCGEFHTAQNHVCDLCLKTDHWIKDCPDQCPCGMGHTVQNHSKLGKVVNKEHAYIYIVGVISDARNDDAPRFCPGENMYFTCDREKAIDEAKRMKKIIPDTYKDGCDSCEYPSECSIHYVVVHIIEYDNGYHLLQSCVLPGAFGGQIGIMGIEDFCDIPYSKKDAIIPEKMYCIGEIGNMQYFTGGWFNLTSSPEWVQRSWVDKLDWKCHAQIKWEEPMNPWVPGGGKNTKFGEKMRDALTIETVYI